MDKRIPPSCCLMIMRIGWELLGGMDESYKIMHFEDMDLYRRAVDEGIGLIEGLTSVQHERAGTRKYLDDRGGGSLLPNKMIYIEKHGSLLPIFTGRMSDGKAGNITQDKVCREQKQQMAIC